jgi:hypothetical protein
VPAYAPEIEWHSAAEDPGLEVFHGVEGVKKLIAEVHEQFEEFRTEPPTRSSRSCCKAPC